MSENRNSRLPIIAAFLAGIAVAAIVAFIIFGQRSASSRKNAAEPESNTQQETQVQAQAGSPERARPGIMPAVAVQGTLL